MSNIVIERGDKIPRPDEWEVDSLEAYNMLEKLMDKGKIIAHGEPKQLIAQHFKEVVLELPENEVANHEFTLPFEYQFKYGYLEIYTKDIATTLNLLKEQNISVDKLKIRQFNLEDLFLKLTGSELRS